MVDDINTPGVCWMCCDEQEPDERGGTDKDFPPTDKFDWFIVAWQYALLMVQ